MMNDTQGIIRKLTVNFPIFLCLLLLMFPTLYGQSADEFAADFVKQPDEASEQAEFKSKPVHVLYSLILPGAGQWSRGYRNRAKFFMGTEFLLWAGFIGSHLYSNVLQNNYQSYAAIHAGVATSDKDDQYWIDIGSAENIYNFNEQTLRNRDIQSYYPETGSNYWQWDSADNRRYYNSLRVKEHDWERRATFMVGTLILNRVISAIDVVRIISKEKKMHENRMTNLSFNYKTNQVGSGVFEMNLTWKW